MKNYFIYPTDTSISCVTCNFACPLDHFPVIDTTKKVLSSSSVSTTSSVSLVGVGSGGGSGDKKTTGGHSIISSLKRLVSDVGNNNGIGNTSVALGEELDGVERGEGAPLSHLTASRAKAPRRRPPSSQHLRHHAAGSTDAGAATLPSVPSTLLVLITLFSHRDTKCQVLISS